MGEHKTKIVVSILALGLIALALFSQKDPSKQHVKSNLSPGEEKHFALLDTSSFLKTKPSDEFFILVANPLDKNVLNISGLGIENKSGQKVFIKNAVQDFIQASVNRETPIIVNKKTNVIISTGKSPVGFSFKENICSGFLNQYQTFIPPLEKNCPNALSIIKKSGVEISTSCQNFLESTSSCKIIDSFPTNLDAPCIKAIKENVNYNQCVGVTKTGQNFYLNNYRIFLNEESEFFTNTQDLIKIIDQSGKVVESKLLLKI